jgi:hypothetical protein
MAPTCVKRSAISTSRIEDILRKIEIFKSKTFTLSGFRFERRHAPRGYPGLETGIEFASLSGPKVGVARRFRTISETGLQTFEKFEMYSIGN